MYDLNLFERSTKLLENTVSELLFANEKISRGLLWLPVIANISRRYSVFELLSFVIHAEKGSIAKIYHNELVNRKIKSTQIIAGLQYMLAKLQSFYIHLGSKVKQFTEKLTNRTTDYSLYFELQKH